MLKIEFLYYDKTACSRCAATNNSVMQSLKELKEAIAKSKIKIDFNERKLPKSKINLSPSILINGRDIELIVNKNLILKTNECTDCCQLIGYPVNCRTFIYKTKSYDYIPKSMILEAIKISSSKA
jgi:hypothetical protein